MRVVVARVVIVSRYPMSDVSPPPARAGQVFLKKKEDFERVKREGARVTTRFFNVMSCASHVGNTRVGIVVGRRFGKAVTRNRGKRVFRALTRTTHKSLLQGNDIVIFPKRSVLELPHSTLCETWVTTLTRQGLMASPDPLSCAQ